MRKSALERGDLHSSESAQMLLAGLCPEDQYTWFGDDLDARRRAVLVDTINKFPGAEIAENDLPNGDLTARMSDE